MNTRILGWLAFGVLAILLVGSFTPNPSPSKSKRVEVYNMVGNGPEFTMCNADPTADRLIIVISNDLGGCGKVSITRHDGSVITGEVDGVMTASPAITVQVAQIKEGKFVKALPYNQVTDITRQ